MNVNFTRQFRIVVWLAIGWLAQSPAWSQTVSTIAGGGASTGLQATAYPMNFPIAVTFDAAGNYYVATNADGSIRKVSTSGVVTTIAGTANGLGSDIVDGALATSGIFVNLSGIAIDPTGNIYVTELSPSKIRKISTTGVVSTIAGTGTPGYNGDGFAATSAQLNFPFGIVYFSGNIYVAELLGHRVRKITSGGIISTVAGTGTAGYNGDGFAATSAQLNQPIGIGVDGTGNLFIADEVNNRIRKVTTGGIISTVAGNGTGGFSGDGGMATSAMINSPVAVAADGSGNIFMTTNGDSRVRKVSSGGIISTLAGTGTPGYGGDGAAATSAQLNAPWGVALDGAGDIFIADESNFRVREIIAGTGLMSTAAGNGSTVIGDNGPATNAVLFNPQSVFVDPSGNVYFPDKNRVMMVDASGNLSTVAGVGIGGTQGDGGPATKAWISSPFGVYKDAAGNLYIGCSGSWTVRKVDPSGTITTFAGNGTQGYSGDGGAATSASIGNAQGITGDVAGNIYITDFDHAVIRKVSPGGVISTFAGTGVSGYAGDGGQATSAQLASPNSICIDAAGNIYVGDDFVNSVRKITPAGIITTVAGGTASTGNTGDGGPATAALFGDIEGLTCDAAGNLFIVDAQNNRVRRVDAGTGIISAFAGNGTKGFAGDGGSALSAEFASPWAAALDAQGNVYVGDATNQRVRKISVAYTLATTNTTVTQTISGTTTRDINDNAFHRVTTVLPTAGGNPLSGSVVFGLSFDPSIQLYNGHPYVTRHYDITPATNAATAQATVTLYFLESEFQDYNNYITTNSLSLPFLPNNPADLGAIPNITILQFHGTGTAPANYTGGLEVITPTVHYNLTNSWWEVSFPVNGFSGFFLTSGTVPLPLRLLSFTGVQQSGNVSLKWTTTDETGTKAFIVERSRDASGWTDDGTVAADNTSGTHSYSFADNAVPAGPWYYRLKMQDIDGKYTYSNVLSITVGGSATGLLLYPNPVKDRLYVQVPSVSGAQAVLRLVDLQGKVLQEQVVELSTGVNAFSFDTRGLARGVYFIQCSGRSGLISRFVKP